MYGPPVELGRAAAEASSHRLRVVKGSALTVAAYFFGSALRLVSNLILARLLFPEAFALVALAGIVTQGLKMFSDIGIGPSIIRSARGADDTFLNTAWTVQIVRGWGLFLAACALAMPFAWFYDTAELMWIIPASAFPSAVSGFNSTSLFTQNRKLQLGKLTMLGLAESVVKLVVTLAWAAFDPSVWAILAGVLVSRVFFTVASHTALPARAHRLQWERGALQELVGFGAWIFLSTIITFFAQQSDRLVLGKLVPLDLLGVYSIAFMFSRLPLEVCGAVTGNVLFPALASIAREHPERLRGALRKARRVILTLGASGTIGFMVASPWFFRYCYDERYQDAVWIAPLMGIVGWFSLLQVSVDRVLLALGDTRSLFLSNAANLLMTVAAGLAGFHMFGIVGFIAGYGVGSLAGHIVVMIAVARAGHLCVVQDLGYSALVAVAAVLGCWLPSAWSMDLATPEGQLRALVQGAVAFVSVVVCSRVVWTSVVRR